MQAPPRKRRGANALSFEYSTLLHMGKQLSRFERHSDTVTDSGSTPLLPTRMHEVQIIRPVKELIMHPPAEIAHVWLERRPHMAEVISSTLILGTKGQWPNGDGSCPMNRRCAGSTPAWPTWEEQCENTQGEYNSLAPVAEWPSSALLMQRM